MWRQVETGINVLVAGVAGFALGPVVFDYTVGPLLLEYGGLGALVEAKFPLVLGIDALLATLIFVGLQRFDQRTN